MARNRIELERLGDKYEKVIKVYICQLAWGCFVGTSAAIIFVALYFSGQRALSPWVQIAVFTFIGGWTFHITACAYKEKIPIVFYKYLEYVYLAMSVVGLMSVYNSYAYDLYMKSVDESFPAYVGRPSPTSDVKNTIECSSKYCLEYQKDQKKYDEMVHRVVERAYQGAPFKFPPTINLLGYLLLSLGLNFKILKTTGEIRRWHKI